jgi:hypothetical protein
MGGIPVNPFPIGDRSIGYREVSTGKIDTIDLGVIVIKDLQQLVLKILFPE